MTTLLQLGVCSERFGSYVIRYWDVEFCVASVAWRFKGVTSLFNGLKSLAKLFNFVVCNPC